MTTSPALSSSERKRPTLKTIAALTGLAQTTVSRALGDAPDISAKTKAKVRQVADEVGYVPNRAGVRLRTGRTNVMALVLPVEPDGLNMTSRLIAAIAGGLKGSPYHLVVLTELPEQDLLDPIRYVVETHSADAVIFNRIEPADPRVRYLLDRGFAFVTHGRSQWQDRHAWVDFDNAAFARLAVTRLVERGRRRLFLLAPPQFQSYGRDIVSAAQQAAADHGVALQLAEPITSDDGPDRIAAAVRDAVGSHHADGLILPTPFAAMAAVNALGRMGVEVGGPLDVVAKETFPLLEMLHANILTVQEDIIAAGAQLARAALHEISHPGQSPMQTLLAPQ